MCRGVSHKMRHSDHVPSTRPPASSAQIRTQMAAQATRDTTPEMALRRELHRRGRRYRVHRRPVPQLRITADIVFPGARIAVFVDGCFWHRCPNHGTAPRANGTWWAEKLQRTTDRDLASTAALRDHGWTVLRIWEHMTASDAADLVEESLRAAAGHL